MLGHRCTDKLQSSHAHMPLKAWRRRECIHLPAQIATSGWTNGSCNQTSTYVVCGPPREPQANHQSGHACGQEPETLRKSAMAHSRMPRQVPASRREVPRIAVAMRVQERSDSAISRWLYVAGSAHTDQVSQRRRRMISGTHRNRQARLHASFSGLDAKPFIGRGRWNNCMTCSSGRIGYGATSARGPGRGGRIASQVLTIEPV